jgi:PAS domain S-box-containing protein
MADKERVNILLVDDQPNNLLALEAMLGDLDENLIRAESGVRALKALLDHEVAVILLDVQMPGLDGFQTAELIRQREKSKSTPIIFVTAMSRSETNVFKGYSLGAVDYLFKPIVPEILRSKVAVFVDLFRKNREVRKQAAELARLSRQTELILHSAADGVIGADTSGKATFINPSALRMTLSTADSAVGNDVHAMLHPRREGVPVCNSGECRVRSAVLGEEMYDVQDERFWRSDGSSFPVEFSATPMRSRGENLVGAVLTFRDVTEKLAAAQAQENERRYKEAEAASEAKDDFLAVLSHELRTPMTAILGWLQMLKLNDLDRDTREEGWRTIESSARLQAQLIDDMLDVSRIIMGKFRIELRRTELGELVAGAVDAAQPSAEQRNVRLTRNIDASGVHVEVDSARFRQVLSNLLSNAVKFTPAGGAVHVEVRAEDANATVTVSDTGEGIDPAFLPHVFDRLEQADTARQQGGLGLGLAIARHIIELHGGRIDAHSEGPDQGSQFTVTLPLHGRAAAGEEVAAAEDASQAEAAR